MAKPSKGNQKGAQTHAEGQYGDATRARLQEQLTSGDRQDETHSQQSAGNPNREAAASGRSDDEYGIERDDGAHRLVEGRQQHDEAEKNSEKTRLSREAERGRVEREEHQVPRGAAGHPNG
jgi:hypothetical protein